MGLENELKNFLEHNFGVNDLIRPLFYNFPIGIRFEIGVDSLRRKRYIKTCNFRANEIFKYIFNENDNVLIVNDHYETDENRYLKYRIRRVSSLIRDYSDSVSYDLSHIIDNEAFNLKRYIYKTKVSEIKIKRLIKIIVKDDFKKFRNKMGSDVYIINPGNAMIYFLYDHRGLDIIAKGLDSIKPIYNKYNEWIMDYNREKIDSLFKVT